MRSIFRQSCYLIFFLSFFMLVACLGSQPKLKPLSPGAVVLAFGDSLTYGTGASPDTSYPHDLEEITGFKVVNAGVPGEETQESLVRIVSELDKTHPSLVIVCLGGNDLMRKRPEEQIKENLKKIILLIQKSGAEVILVAVPHFSWTLSVPDLYADLGRELKVPVEAKTIAELERTPQYKSDYIHFNKAGYRALAEALARFLKEEGALI